MGKKVGRPSGRKKTSKIEILLEPVTKEKFMEYLREEGKCASTEIGYWIRDYIREYETSLDNRFDGGK
ncbi:antitoxin [Lottiidibacillus patelloidae]|uniref:Antitoxin n=1 Tax=Lottiidibacillus patelloidae TaxID=2670334 RepID=A0A263BTI6_9BACI|nr:antitoxin [Lottiidibacillus patelloidae]OZM56878.1 antitoxin [Lottiidibacillus patelloidae]